MQVARLLAPNPGPWTGPGTNTYVVSSEAAAVIVDPGPEIASHVDAIHEAIEGLSVTAVVATHHHLDHTEAAPAVASRLGVPTLGFPHDGPFNAAEPLADGDSILVGSEAIEVIHTPGHTPDSICLLAGGQLLTGDTVKGGSTVVVEDMRAYMASLSRLISIAPAEIQPGHGDPQDPGLLSKYLQHRLKREEQVAVSIAHGNVAMPDLIASIYGDLDPSLIPLATRSIQAHIDKLVADGRMTGEGRWLG